MPKFYISLIFLNCRDMPSPAHFYGLKKKRLLVNDWHELATVDELDLGDEGEVVTGHGPVVPDNHGATFKQMIFEKPKKNDSQALKEWSRNWLSPKYEKQEATIPWSHLRDLPTWCSSKITNFKEPVFVYYVHIFYLPFNIQS